MKKQESIVMYNSNPLPDEYSSKAKKLYIFCAVCCFGGIVAPTLFGLGIITLIVGVCLLCEYLERKRKKLREVKFKFTEGVDYDQIFEAYKMAQAKGVKRFGLHTMVISNERRTEGFIYTAELMFNLAVEIKNRLGIELEFVNLGGGVGIPYRPEEEPVDLEAVGKGIQQAYKDILGPAGLTNMGIKMESGRAITGPAGWLVSTVLHEKKTYKDYIGLDSCMANLMRPALYGAYHHITISGKENALPALTLHQIINVLSSFICMSYIILLYNTITILSLPLSSSMPYFRIRTG